MKVEITIRDLTELKTSQRYDKAPQGRVEATITITAQTTPAAIARITHLAACKIPMYAILGSENAETDVDMQVRTPMQLALGEEARP